MNNICNKRAWYNVSFGALFVVYVAFWLWTIWFSGLQASQGLKPILPTSHVADSSEYSVLADSLTSGRGFIGSNGSPEYFRTPGYPVFIAAVQTLTGGSLFAVTFVQIVLVFVMALIIRSIGALLFSKRVGEVASILFLLNPFMWVVTLTILSDVLFIFLFISGIYILLKYFPEHRYHATIWSAIIFSLAVYVRPVGVFALPVFLAPLAAIAAPFRSRIYAAVAIAAIIVAAMVPWMYRNEELSGAFTFSSLKSYNLASYNIPIFLSLQNGTSIGAETDRIALETGVAYATWRDAAYSAKLDRQFKYVILAHPFAYAKFHIISTLPFFFVSPITSFVESWYGTVLRTQIASPKAAIFHLTQGNIIGFVTTLFSNGWYTLSKLIAGLVILLAIFGVWLCRRKPAVWVFAFIIVYMALLAGPVSNIRYRMPVEPMIFLLAVQGLIMLYSRFKRHEKAIN